MVHLRNSYNALLITSRTPAQPPKPSSTILRGCYSLRLAPTQPHGVAASGILLLPIPGLFQLLLLLTSVFALCTTVLGQLFTFSSQSDTDGTASDTSSSSSISYSSQYQLLPLITVLRRQRCIRNLLFCQWQKETLVSILSLSPSSSFAHSPRSTSSATSTRLLSHRHLYPFLIIKLKFDSSLKRRSALCHFFILHN